MLLGSIIWDVPYIKDEDLESDVKRWLVDHLSTGSIIGESNFMGIQAECMADYLDTEWHMPKNLPTYEDWIATGKWMRGKAGTGLNTVINIDGKNRRTRKMKAIEASLFTDSQMAKDLLTVQTEEYFIMQKVEAGKVRAAAKTGNRLFRTCDWLSSWTEVGLKNTKTSPLYVSSKNQDKMDADLMECASNQSLYKVPVDQARFDHNQSIHSIFTVLLVIGIHLTMLAPEDMRKAWQAMWDSQFTLDTLIHLGSLLFVWGNGVPSGLRWTAYLDTMLNVSSFRTCKRIAEELAGESIPISYDVYQGDDISLATLKLRHIRILMHVFNSCGFEAHAEKTFISRLRTEFLRRSYEAETGITGYVPRTLLSLRFRSPVKELEILKGSRVYSRMCLWNLHSLRGAIPEKCGEMFMEDAAQMSLNLTDVAGFVLCPAAYGGGGLDWSSNFAVPIIKYHILS